MNGFFSIQQFEIENNTSTYNLDKVNVRYISMYNSINQIGYILSIDYNDITDIKNKLHIKGGETVNIHFKDYFDNEFRKDFILSNVKLLTEQNEQNHIIRFTLVSKESYYLSINRDYSYYNSTALNVFRNYIATTSTLTSLTNDTQLYDIIIPGFSRTKAITYINNQFTDNFFFERSNEYIYSSIDDLVQQDSTHSYRFISTNNIDKELIIDYDEIKVFDSLDEGYYNNYKRRNLMYNADTKTIETRDYTIGNIQSEAFTLGSGQNYSTEINEAIETTIHRENNYPNALDDVDTPRLFNKEYELLVYGDLSLETGTIVDIRYKDRFNDNPNPLLAGKYLVTKIASHIDGKLFYNKITIAKNAYYRGNVVNNVVV